MDQDSQNLLNEMPGKTIRSVEHGDSFLTINFTDGSTVSVQSKGSDEGCWLSIRKPPE